MTACENTLKQMKGLRCSVPPYYVGLVLPDGVPVAAFPGETYERLERGFAPAAGEGRAMLVQLRGELRWSRAMLAAFMGVSRDVVRRWETGERNPSGAARRLIWLLLMLAKEPDSLKSAMDLIFWGGKTSRHFGRDLRRNKSATATPAMAIH
jgi:DNA-binding XRE family transcriptional regulator